MHWGQDRSATVNHLQNKESYEIICFPLYFKGNQGKSLLQCGWEAGFLFTYFMVWYSLLLFFFDCGQVPGTRVCWNNQFSVAGSSPSLSIQRSLSPWYFLFHGICSVQCLLLILHYLGIGRWTRGMVVGPSCPQSSHLWRLIPFSELPAGSIRPPWGRPLSVAPLPAFPSVSNKQLVWTTVLVCLGLCWF